MPTWLIIALGWIGFIVVLYIFSKVINAKPVIKKLKDMQDKSYEFPEEVKRLTANDPALLVVKCTLPGYDGFGIVSTNLIATATRVIISTKKPSGVDVTDIPYSQILSVQFNRSNFTSCPITITTQADTIVVHSLIRDANIEMVNFIHKKVSDLCGVSIALEHKKSLSAESWSFYAPLILATPVRSNVLNETITDQIKKLAELRDNGILTKEEFENKKSELLKRL